MDGAARRARASGRSAARPVKWLWARFGWGRIWSGISYLGRPWRYRKAVAGSAGIIFVSLCWAQVDSYLFLRAQSAEFQEQWVQWHKPTKDHRKVTASVWPSGVERVISSGASHAPTAPCSFLMGSRAFAVEFRSEMLLRWGLASLASLLATWALISGVVLLLERKIRPPKHLVAGFARELTRRAPPLLALQGLVMIVEMGWWAVLVLDSPFQRIALVVYGWVSIAIQVLVFLTAYAIVGLGTGWRAGLVGGLRILWRRPGVVLTMLLAVGGVLVLLSALGWPDGTSLWLTAGERPVMQTVGQSVLSLALMVPAALVRAWAMMAFLLLVLDNKDLVIRPGPFVPVDV